MVIRVGRTKYSPMEDVKSNLAVEISRIPQISVDDERRRFESPFVDWYLVLQVEEDADCERIRKQYHKLALMLHPDKNQHPKAEIAFKLVLEAYACLTNEARRGLFNLERWSRKNQIHQDNNATRKSTSSLSSTHSNERIKESHSKRFSRAPSILQQIRKQMAEEARVIENCLKINRKCRSEYPVFSPSSYQQQGYPHKQSRQYKGVEDVGFLERGSVPAYHRRAKCETPVFEIRTEFMSMNVRSTCLSS